MSQSKPQQREELRVTLKKSAKRAFGGGISGASAMVVQVVSLMWLRTTMNYQYRYGTTMKESFKILYKQGGVFRFYKGIVPGLLQGPLSRFGDTAANVGSLALLDSFDQTKNLPVGIKTLFASQAAGLFRIFLMPIDTFKTIMQVEGKNGLKMLFAKIRKHGIFVIYNGSIASASATFVGHYPWFFTYNTLNGYLPLFPDSKILTLCRNGGIGLTASIISDTCSNSLRVLKTYRQTAEKQTSYAQSVKDIIAKDGIGGLFGRGLTTRWMTNGLQSMMFTIMWRYFQDKFFNKPTPAAKKV